MEIVSEPSKTVSVQYQTELLGLGREVLFFSL